MIELITPRLRIRDHVPGDFETHHALFSDPVAMRYLDDIMTHSPEESRANLYFAIQQSREVPRKYVFLRIELKDTSEHVGEIGYTASEFALGTLPKNEPDKIASASLFAKSEYFASNFIPGGWLADIGYFLRPEHWGKGYATEALQRVMRFGFGWGNVLRFSCGCLQENAASERVMIKCGMIKEAHFKQYVQHEGQLKDRVVYRMLRDEWEAFFNWTSCLAFTNEEIIDGLIPVIQARTGLNPRIEYNLNPDVPNPDAIFCLTFDEAEDFALHFYDSFLAIFQCNEEFMLIDDIARENISSSETYHNVVYDGALRGKSRQELYALVAELIYLLNGAEQLSIEEELLYDPPVSYPRYNYRIQVRQADPSNGHAPVRLENIHFTFN